MLEMFYPDCREASAWSIDYAGWYEKGYRGVIFDIDNTLSVHGGPPPEETLELFRRLKALGFAACLVSNNKEPRVRPFACAVDVPYISKAGKPSVRGYEAAMARMGTDRAHTMFVGDQLFTDIFGARRAGLKSILVDPIDPHEEIQIVCKRYLEKIVLFFYARNSAS
ncbi:MAG: HAD-IIIA family hydrolase [Lachnospiraceae bacterium]|jgi:HAD superfamily phosphatase (TIGR01668 family)|nr:HAD-IIIA family hydrolase [Lachnospiraceae bacterium]